MQHQNFSHVLPIVAVTAFVSAMPGFTIAEEASASHGVLSQVNVIGDPSAIYTIPGSAHYIDYESIKEFSYDDINRVLRRVPGVYIREEDGYGLFPNISLRGVNTGRSAKVTIMEDGILSAPAPYAAPAAYYSPTTARMYGLEVLKGTSQIKYGPHTTGGAINYLSTPIPLHERIFLRSQYGEDNDIRTHAVYGNTLSTEAGRFGYLFEGYFRNTDGFKTIDAAPGFNNTDQTGFTNIEPMVKLAWEPLSSVYQRFEFKYGFTDKEADETYLGLSTADFRADPFRRYSASRFDNIETEQHRTYLRHFISPADNFDLVTTVYYNKFARNWYKLDNIGGVAGLQNGLSGALAGSANGNGLACLKGEFACTLSVRSNDRTYYGWGAQSEGTVRFDTGILNHELTAGVRYHRDEEDRFQHYDVYTQAANGAITDVVRGLAGSQDDREARTSAIALFMQDRIEMGNWWLTPGIRYEHLDLELRDFRPGPRISGDRTLILHGGGVGIGYNITSEWQAFGGVHFGFSPPSPSELIVENLKEETSTGYEAGLRYASRDQVLSAEAVGFLTKFEDLIVVQNIGAGGLAGEGENFGKVDSYGVELSGQFDLGRANQWTFNNPYFLAFTYTNAEQKSDAQSANAESIFSFGKKGNKVPYIPEYQLTVGSSLEFARWGASLSASFVDETFTSANNVSTETNGLGQPDARFSKTDSYTVVDFSTHYNIKEGVQLFGGIHNLFDEEYIVSRQPHGPRPGAPRLWFVGIELEL
jgi:Fe(3+) dicitrate transport protein